MKCPRCGAEMTLDGHRKIDLYMCYECGYIEGRNMGPATTAGMSNYERLKQLTLTESASLLSGGLDLDLGKVTAWLEKPVD